MPSVLLATCADLPGGDEDANALTSALSEAGVSARWAVWTDQHVRWDEAAVVIRSTWDYHSHLDRFRTWTSSVPRLHNAAEIVAWNTDKLYLRDLAAVGVPIVPSAFFASGETVEFPDAARTVEFVVKPSVGAGSRGAGRFSSGTIEQARRHADALHAAGRTVLVQPFLEGVDIAGETALLYAAGAFSHAIRKGPMLSAGAAHAVDGASLFIAENITARVPDPGELEVGERALAAVRERFAVMPLYARVDLLPGPDGPVVTELELTEPSWFLGDDAAAAARFASAIAAVA